MSKSIAKRILLVEDEAILAMNEKTQLEKYGYAVTTVTTGEKAVEAVRASSDIDLILMDINLGDGIDGTEAAEIILKDHDIPIVFLSSHTEPEVVEKTEKITSYGYVVKNSCVTVLDASIKMAFKLFDAHIRLEQENGVRRRAETESKTNATLYRSLMENSIDAVYLLSETGSVLNVNSMACEMMGYTRDELTALTIDDIDPNYPSRSFMMFWADKPEGSTVLFQSRHKRKDGTILDVEINGIFFVLDGQKLLFGVARDITKRKHVEEELGKFKTISDSAVYGNAIADLQGNVLYINKFFANIHGYEPEDLIGKHLSLLHNERQLEAVERLNASIIPEGHFAPSTVWHCHKDGTEFPMLMSGVLLKDDYGHPQYIAASAVDVSELVRIENELKESVTRHQDLVAMIPVGVYIAWAPANGQIDFEYVSDRWCVIHGLRREDVIANATTVIGLVHPNDRESFLKLTRDAADEGKRFVWEGRFFTGDGQLRWLRIDSTPVVRKDGDIRWFGVTQDITDHKHAEERYRLLFDLSNDAIFVHEIGDDSRPTRNIEVNEQATRLLGYTREELLNMSARDVVPEKHFPAMHLHGQELMEKKHLTFESENVRSDGVVIPIEVSAHLHTEGNRKLVVSSVRDITARKQAEEAVARKTKLLEAAQTLANLGSWEWDIVNDTWFFSEQWKKIHGVSDNDFDTSKLMEIAHPEDAPYIEKAFSEAKEQGKSYDIEHRIIRADNREIRYVKALGNVEFDEETGRPVRLVGSSQDITERKRMEAELSFQNILMKTQQEVSLDGIIAVDENGKITSFNQRLADIWGIPDEVMALQSAEHARQFVLPKLTNPNDFVTRIRDLYETRHEKSHEEITLADGRVLERYSSPMYGPHDEYYGRVWFYRDVTEKKRLQRSLELRSEVLQHVGQAVIATDLQGEVFFWNQTAELIFGFAPEEAIGKSILELTPTKQTRKQAAEIMTKLSQGEKWSGEFTVQRKDGSSFPAHVTNTPIFNQNGQLTGIIGISTDITERRLAEEEIQKQLSEKELLLREVHHRVKNNISTIESLLSLQAGSTAHDEVKKALQDTISRVQSTRVLYDKLLLSEDLHEVSMKDYAEGLIDSLAMVFHPENTMTIEKHISDFEIDARKVFSVGIIVNELLTNVFKYAFRDRENGLVSVSIEKEGNEVTLIIKDDGTGFDEKSLKNESPGFGLTIVKMLVEQLGGTYSLANDNGARSRIRFEL